MSTTEGQQRYTIAVRNVSRNCTETHLQEIFGHFGTIVGMTLETIPRTSRLVADITYSSSTEAESAVTSMNGGVIDGIQLEVAHHL